MAISPSETGVVFLFCMVWMCDMSLFKVRLLTEYVYSVEEIHSVGRPTVNNVETSYLHN